MDNSNQKTRLIVKTFFLVALCAMVFDLLKISQNKLGCEITKPEKFKQDTVPQQMKDGTIVNGPDTLKFDTLKLEKNVSWFKACQQKIMERKQNVR